MVLASPQVTVVVPVYDVEEYLTECLESLAGQTSADAMRVVVVDDGSTDRSGQIAAEFVERHPSFTLVRQANGGLGAARNRGLREVDTPFIMFCDSDDRLPLDAVARLLAAMEATEADVVVGSMRSFPQLTAWPWLQHLDGSRTLLDGIEAAPELVHGASACNKLFRTDRLNARGLRFAEGSHFEDIYVTLPVLLEAGRIALVPEVVYEYRKRDTGSSIMDGLWTREDNYWDHLRAEEFLAQLRTSLPAERAAVVDLFMVRSLQGFLLRAPSTLPAQALPEYFRRSRAVYQNVAPQTVLDGCLDTRHRLPFVGLLLGRLDVFAHPGDHVQGVVANDGVLRLRLDGPVPAALEVLLVTDRIVAHLESIDLLPRGRGLRLTGRLSIDGFVPAQGPPAELGVRVRGSGVTVPAKPVRRITRQGAEQVNSWTGFVADVPTKRLKVGEHRLRLVLTTEQGQASTRLRPSLGLRRSTRVLPLKGRRVRVGSDQFDSVTMRVASTGTRRASWFWRWRAATSDLAHALHRKPLWRARLTHLVTAPFFRHRSIWLLVERRDTAQDNSFFLFRYLRTAEPDRAAYYVLASDSPHRWKVEPYGNVVAHSSWRHRLLMLHANWLIGSYDIDAYALPRQWSREHYLRHLSWRVGSRRAFLQHGVTYNDVSHALHRSVTGLDVFVTSSDAEAEFVRSRMAYPTQVHVTGLPRFDNLTPVPSTGRILLMPTWRSTLVSPSYAAERPSAQPFEGSAYQAFFRELLNDERLLCALIEHDVTLEVLPHYEFAGLVDDLAPTVPHVVVAHHRDRDVQQAIRECSLFVTDWSSTLFDAAYLGVPQVLLPFDEESFRRDHYAPGYFDLDDDGFGPVARTVPSAVDAILGYIANGFVREGLYTARAQTFFAHHDTANSARVVAAIDATPTVPRELPPLSAWGVQEADEVSAGR